MATRDLHDQKILRALEGIEKQLKVQNGIFGDMSAGVNCNMKCKEKTERLLRLIFAFSPIRMEVRRQLFHLYMLDIMYDSLRKAAVT